MPRSRFREEQIVVILKEPEAGAAPGLRVGGDEEGP
jgi:hypothetical protein